jgi:lipopolysaccharide transport system ATP-binding protein
MDEIAVHVENLGKRYRLGQREQSKMLRELIANVACLPLGYLKRGFISNNGNDYIWALKDVSFDIQKGEVVGIIGRNGAGKSTLLKILSRITMPTEGLVELNGRVGSLLEVGTGFHSELTGRENIYLSGSILGMRKREIEGKFEEIVRFSEIEKFLDTPVKRYSSGMYVRLAFAVAAHLDPEILLVDEVLAVGDAGFQKKCLGKMKEVSGEGRTVLFVSHNMNAVERLCNSCMMFERGQLKRYSDNVRDIIKDYLFGAEDGLQPAEWVNTGDELNNPWFKPLRFYIGDGEGHKVSMPSSNNSEMWVYIEGEIRAMDPALTIGYAIYCEDGTLLYWSYQTDEGEDKRARLNINKNIIRGNIPNRFLNEGTYRIELIGGLHFRQWLFEPGKTSPSIFLTIKGGLSDSPYWMSRRPGAIAPVLGWDGIKGENN